MKIKRIKPLCECGNPSQISGYCRNCYMKHYMRRRVKTEKSHHKPKEYFNGVLSRVETGKPIYIACSELNISTKQLYNSITTDQKNRLFDVRREVALSYAV